MLLNCDVTALKNDAGVQAYYIVAGDIAICSLRNGHLSVYTMVDIDRFSHFSIHFAESIFSKYFYVFSIAGTMHRNPLKCFQNLFT